MYLHLFSSDAVWGILSLALLKIHGDSIAYQSNLNQMPYYKTMSQVIFDTLVMDDCLSKGYSDLNRSRKENFDKDLLSMINSSIMSSNPGKSFVSMMKKNFNSNDESIELQIDALLQVFMYNPKDKNRYVTTQRWIGVHQDLARKHLLNYKSMYFKDYLLPYDKNKDVVVFGGTKENMEERMKFVINHGYNSEKQRMIILTGNRILKENVEFGAGGQESSDYIKSILSKIKYTTKNDVVTETDMALDVLMKLISREDPKKSKISAYVYGNVGNTKNSTRVGFYEVVLDLKSKKIIYKKISNISKDRVNKMRILLIHDNFIPEMYDRPNTASTIEAMDKFLSKMNIRIPTQFVSNQPYIQQQKASIISYYRDDKNFVENVAVVGYGLHNGIEESDEHILNQILNGLVSTINASVNHNQKQRLCKINIVNNKNSVESESHEIVNSFVGAKYWDSHRDWFAGRNL